MKLFRAEAGNASRTLTQLARKFEKAAARLQGKGYGTATIERENKCVQQLLGMEPRLAVDIGGNVGEYTAELRRRYHSVEIHVFEPSSVNIGRLRTRFSGDDKITIVPAAVSETSGHGTLYADVSGSGMSSLAPRQLSHRGIDFHVQESVPVVCFGDYWVDVLGSRRLDIVKLDIEGFELAALRGFGGALAATAILQFEFGGCNVDTRTFFRDFWLLFESRGFELYRITPLGLEHIRRYRDSDECFTTTNYLARNLSPPAP